MTTWRLAWRSLIHYWRSNAAVALGVAVATAVLTGALLVGESMRSSLRELTMDRLGDIDELLVSDGFFRAALADEIAAHAEFQQHYDAAVPVILFPNGTVERDWQDAKRRASGINVFGVDEGFWDLGRLDVDSQAMVGRKIIINQALADELKWSTESNETVLTLRIPKPSQLPADSALGKQDDLVEALVDLEVLAVVPNESLGRFHLHPSQATVPNLFAPIELLQDALQRDALKHKADQPVANVVLFAGKGELPPAEEVTEILDTLIRPRLVDYGITVNRVSQTFAEEEQEAVTVFDYWSLSSDRLVLPATTAQVIRETYPAAKEVLTYLANDIRRSGEESGIPFSMVSAVDIDGDFPLISSVTGKTIRPLKENEIVLNEWAAKNLDLKIGEEIELAFFEPETTHGTQVERTERFRLVDIARLTTPLEPYHIRRRREVIPAVFDQMPTVANDPDLTPEVPGVTDAETIENWDLPFSTADKIRPADDEYWNDHRTTPKGFVSLAMGQRLWDSRFGKTTSFRIPPNGLNAQTIEQQLSQQLSVGGLRHGFRLVRIKLQGLRASSGSTPFDALFLGLSMFVIGAALILVSLLFRLGLQNRAAEIGLFRAVGLNTRRILAVWLREALLVCSLGAVLGIALGVGYGALMIFGLRTWWVGAISEPFIQLHIGNQNLLIGLFSGIAICVLTIVWSLRRTNRESVNGLLQGRLEQTDVSAEQRGISGRWIGVLFACAIGLSVVAIWQSGDAQAGAFMGSGFLLLAAILMAIYRWLSRSSDGERVLGLGIGRLAVMSARRHPLRSALTAGLVAAASFLIASVSSFRLAPSDRGTAGFDYLATSAQPIFADLNTQVGQQAALGREYLLPESTTVRAFRLKPGEDASCNNVYQSAQPQVLGVTDDFINSFDDESVPRFAWAGTSAKLPVEKVNPWRLLRDSEVEEGRVPCVIDKNTAYYSLKIFGVGAKFTVVYDTGESIDFQVIGLLDNTVLQGSLFVSEQNFVSAFPSIGGYRFFLVEDGGQVKTIERLEDRLSDQGFDATSATRRLGQFMQVQNTYLSTFQALGALGLLLGTFGLAAVQVRNVVHRTRELGLMRAVGFRRRQLSWMVLLETSWLLVVGLVAGWLSAAFATVPHFLLGNASIPWPELAGMFALILGVGVVVSWVASRRIGKMPLLESLRA